MSTSIEQRVVQMRFDNKQFEAGVAESMSTLDKFRAKLNFKGAAKGFDDINRVAAKVSLQPMADQIDRVSVKFNGLAVVAATALSRITNAAISTGKNMVKALTLDPVTTGFREYETKLNSIQTIMSNTASKGTTMEDVTKVLDELNDYADKTIYNFGEMARNIGLFTAAGVDVYESADAIRGISNLAASVGTNATDTARVMYQLSQALSSGAVRLQDWRSLESAGGMAGEKFQEALKKTAREQGIAVDQMIEKNGNFRESLKEGWLSTEVLNTTLRKFTVQGAKEYAQAMLESGKYTQAQADALIAEAQAMEDAATKVKTFTQLWGALQEAAQSGWGKSWEIIVGDFEEARELFTNISNVIGGFIEASANARNEMLQGWKDLGGRTAFIKTLSKAFENFTNVVSALRDAFRDIFPRITAQQLYDATLALKNFVYRLALSDEAINTLRVAFKALLIPIQIVIQAVRIGTAAFGVFIQICFRLADALLSLFSRIGKEDDPFKKLFGDNRYNRLAKALATIISNLGDAFGKLGDKVAGLLKPLTNIFSSGISGVFDRIGEALKPLANWILDKVVEGFEAFASIDFSKNGAVNGIRDIANAVKSLLGLFKKVKNPVGAFLSQFRSMSPVDILNAVAKKIQNVLANVSGFFKSADIRAMIDDLAARFGIFGDTIKKVSQAIVEFIDRLTPAKILVFSFGATLVIMMMNFSRVLSSLSKAISVAKKTFDAVTGLLSAITQKIKGNKIVQVALSLTALALALKFLSTADPEGLKQATISILSLMAAITGMTALLGVISKFLVNTPELVKNLQMVGVAMIAMAGSVAILAGALWILSKIDMEGMGIKLIALVLVMGAAAIAIDELGHYSGDALGKAAVILSFAAAIAMIAHAIAELSKENISLSFNTVIALISIVTMLKLLANQVRGVRFSGGAGMVLLVLSLTIFANSLKKLSKYDTGTLLMGLINFIPIFVTLKLLSNVIGGAKEVSRMGTQILAISVSMFILQKAIEKLGNMDLSVVVKGGIVVGALILVFGLMQRIANVSEHGAVQMKGSFIAMAAAILILGLAIGYIGGLSLKAVAQGTAVVSILLILLTSLAEAIGPAQKSTAAVVAITVCLGLLIAAIALLTLLDPKELGVSVGGLSAVMLSLGGMFKLIGEIKIGAAISVILVMTALLAELGYAFRQLNSLDPIGMLATATALSEVMVALGITAKMFKITYGIGGDLFKTGAMLIAMVAAAGGVVYALNQMPIQEGLIEKASALSLLMVTLGSVATLMSHFNAGFIKTGSAGFGIAAFMAILAVTLTALGALFSLSIGEYTLTSFLENGINTVNSMYKIIPAITVIGLVAGVFSKFNIDVVACAQASFGIGIFMTVLTAFVTLIGAFFQQFPNLEADLDKAVQVFPKIGAALGGLIGGFGQGLIAALTGGIMESLKGIATAFSDFITNIGPFLDGLDKVDASKVEAVSSLGTMILALTAADILNSINKLAGKDLLGNFAEQLKAFGPKFAEFAGSIANINTEAVTACATALKTFAEVIVAIPQDVDFLGIFSKTTNFEGFGEGMKSFAEAFKKFAEVIDTSTLSEETVARTRNAMQALTDMANNIPTSGGVLEEFFGKKDIANFGSQMQSFATNLMGFFKIVSDGNVDAGLVEKCANAGKALADFASNIPSTGGKLQTITGIKDMSLFGNQLIGYAVGLVGFFNTLNGANTEAGPVNIDKGLVDKAAYAGSAFAELTKQLPGTGGIWQRFVGSVDLGTFGNDIQLFGQGLYNFFYMFNSLKITDEQVEIAKNAGMAFSELVNNIQPNEGAVALFKKVNLEMYGTDLSALGEGMKGFYTAISTVNFDVVTSAVESIKSILGLQTEMENITTTGAINFRTYLTKLGEVGLDDFATSFANGEDKLKTAVETTLISALENADTNLGSVSVNLTGFIGAIINGVTSKRQIIETLAGDVVSWFRDSFELRKDFFESCGTTIVESLYLGASTKLTEYSAKFEELANSIVSAISKGFNIVGSISLEFQSIGKYCIAGFMKGFESEANIATSRVRAIANNIAVTTEDALGVASPSTKFAEIGMYCIQGLVNGINENTKYAADQAIKMGAKLLESVKQFFGIKSPSTVMRDEVGRYIVDGIADGITYNTSAEEAASKKAQNIVNAFKTEFDKLDQVLNTKNLEYELWQAMNPNASVGESNLKQVEMLDSQMKIQAERVNAANAQYQATLKTLGENASQTRDAYNTYLEEKISLADLAATLNDTQQNNAQAFRQFDEFFRDTLVDLEGMGFTQEEIWNYAKNQTGWYDPRAVSGSAAGRGSVEDVMNQYLQMTTAGTGDVETVIVRSTANAMTKSAGIARQGGQNVVQSMAQGVQSNPNPLIEAVENVTGLPVSNAIENGKNVVEGFKGGFLDSANNFIVSGGDAAVKKLGEVIPLLNQVTGCESPSRFTYETGTNVVQGFINGLSDGTMMSGVANSALNTGSKALNAISSQVSQYPIIGSQMMAGLANGIAAGASGVISAAISVAKRAIAASRAILAIRSPSREYYEIGKYMDQGLANGILDNAGVVTNAISSVLEQAQAVIDANRLYISPVVENGAEMVQGFGGAGSWIRKNDEPENYSQLLQWDANGNLIPVGFSNNAMHRENGAWWIAPTKEIADSIRYMGDKVAEEDALLQSYKGRYEGTIEEFKSAIEELASQPKVEYNQTINSPKNVNAADVERHTNTQLAPLKNQYTNPDVIKFKSNAAGGWMNKK